MKVTPEKIERLKKYLDRGMSRRGCAERLGINASQVGEWVARHLPSYASTERELRLVAAAKDAKREQATERKVAQRAIRMLTAGQTVNDIAEALGVSRGKARTLLESHEKYKSIRDALRDKAARVKERERQKRYRQQVKDRQKREEEGLKRRAERQAAKEEEQARREAAVEKSRKARVVERARRAAERAQAIADRQLAVTKANAARKVPPGKVCNQAISKFSSKEKQIFVTRKLKVLVQNAKRRGVKMKLCLEDLECPDTCPVLGIALDYTCTRKSGTSGQSEHKASFDRINPSKGYVSGNVVIVSWRANRIRNNGTAAEHAKIARYYKGKW